MGRSLVRVAPLFIVLIFNACGGESVGEDTPRCGDGIKNLDEKCDAADLAGSTCQSLGFGQGKLVCRFDCADFDRAGCGAPKTCGDGKLTPPELCDGGLLGGKTCEALGFSGGTLGCLNNCAGFDTSTCAKPKTCGNGKLDPKELCDAKNLGGKTCQSLGYAGGTLRCLGNCSGYDTSQCETKPKTCGNGKLDPKEKCDAKNLGGKTCKSLGFGDGPLGCAKDCLSFDTSGCAPRCTPDCKGRVCGLDPVCGTKKCGTCNSQSICDAKAGACVQICDLSALTADATIDVPLKTITVSGVIRLGGKVMPGNGKNTYSSRGSVRFTDKKSGAYASASLGHSGPAAYSVTLFPGTYTVTLAPSSSSSQDVLPPYYHLLDSALVLKATTTKIYDVKIVDIGGVVTLGGKPMTTNGKNTYSSRGSLRFTDKSSGSYVTASLGHTGPAAYVVKLYAGTYAVTLAPSNSSSQDVLPPYYHLLNEALILNTSKNNLGFNLKVVQVNGAVTLNGGTMPTNGKNTYSSRGSLRFTDVKAGSYVTASLGHGGPASYTATLYAGTYNVRLAPSSSSSQDVLPPYHHQLSKDLALTASAAKSFNLKVIQVNGAVTLNGGAMPTNGKNTYSSRGSLRLTDRTTGSYVTTSLGHGGPAAYSATLYAGTYDVRLSPSSSSSQDVLPPYLHQLAKDVALTASAAKNYDLKTVTINGTVTLNGGTMPTNGKNTYSSRGSLRFTDRKTWNYVTASLGHGGPATYSATLYAGAYDVSLVPSSSSSQDVLPSYRHQLAEGLALNASTTKAFDAKTIKIDGKVTLNGGVMPTNGKNTYSSRGSVRFTDRLTGAYTSTTFHHGGAAVYGLTVYKGTYDVDVIPSSSSSQDVLPPYRTKVRVGCFKAGPCSLSKADVSGAWRIITPLSWGTVYLDLNQSGQNLGGTFKFSMSSGSITSGTVKGDAVELKFKTYSCYVAISGTLQDGCTWTGTYTPTGTCGGGGWGATTSFFGQRSK